MKKIISAFIIGVIITASVSYAIADTYINSLNVTYKSDYTDKTTVDDALDELYENVDALDKSDATAENILSGKKAAVGRKLVTGTMPNLGAWTSTPESGNKVTIPAGYHNGNGYVDLSNIFTSSNLSITNVLNRTTSVINEVYEVPNNTKYVLVLYMYKEIDYSGAQSISVNNEDVEVHTLFTEDEFEFKYFESATNRTYRSRLYLVDVNNLSNVEITLNNHHYSGYYRVTTKMWRIGS